MLALGSVAERFNPSLDESFATAFLPSSLLGPLDAERAFFLLSATTGLGAAIFAPLLFATDVKAFLIVFGGEVVLAACTGFLLLATLSGLFEADLPLIACPFLV